MGVIMKVSIIGVGSVGSAVATALMKSGLVSEIVLFDIDGARVRAAALDLTHASVFGFDIKIIPARNYRQLRGSDIVIIAAGANQKNEQSRSDLLNENQLVITDVMTKLVKQIDNKNTKVIMVTNPLDVMVMLSKKISKMPAGNIIGTGTMLDTARFKIALSNYLGVSHNSINASVFGEHGDSAVLNWSAVTIGNIPLVDFCKQNKTPLSAKVIKEITNYVHGAACEIICGRCATWDGIAAAVAELVRVIINNEQKLLTVSSADEKGFAMSLPRIVGARGIIKTVKPSLNAAEKSALQKSGGIIKKNFKQVK